jgi:hypothetical protein
MARSEKQITRVTRALNFNFRKIMSLPNVVGVGVGNRQRKGKFTERGTLVLHVFVEKKYAANELPLDALVPREVFGPDDRRAIATDVIEVGTVRAARFRPVPGGCSVGSQSISIPGGTLGGFACDTTDGTPVLLTCNHVIAHEDEALLPSGILQPSANDGGFAPDDLIGNLKRFVPITVAPFSPTLPISPVDAAIGKINVANLAAVLDIGPAIFVLGRPTIHMRVKKRGRTTGLTTNGRIRSVNVVIDVNYGALFTDDRVALIGNSFLVESTDGNPFVDFGDSGSLTFSTTPIPDSVVPIFPVVGMGFARGSPITSPPASTYSWHNDISAVLSELNLAPVCTCAARTLVQTILAVATAPTEGSASSGLVNLKEEQFRKFLDHTVQIGPLGKMLAKFVRSEAAELSQAICEDEEAFGLAVRTLDPWVRRRTNLDVLEAELDAETVANFVRLADRIGKVKPELRERLFLVKVAIAAAQGTRVGDILKRGLPTQKSLVKRKRTRAKH